MSQQREVSEFVRRNPVRRGFGYTRVSTDDQENNTSHEQQELDIRAEAAKRGVFLVQVFHENFTGAVWRERPVLQEMRRRYLQGEVDCIFFRTYDRLSREPAHYYILSEEMKVNNVETVCVMESNDTSVIGQLIQMMILSFAKMEREKIAGRTRDGKLARVTIKQRYNAGNKPPYGYSFPPEKEKGKLVKGKLLINQDEAKIVVRIFTLRANRTSYYKIACTLNEEGTPSPAGKLWSEMTIRRILEQGPHLYSGNAYGYQYKVTRTYEEGRVKSVSTVRPQEEWIALPEGTVPAIVDGSLVSAALGVKEAMQQDAGRNNHHPEQGMLRSGFVRCGKCGRAMSPSQTVHKEKTYWSYVCTRAYKSAGTCTGMSIPLERCDQEIWGYLEETITNLEIIEEAAEHVLGLDLFGAELKTTSLALEEVRRQIGEYKEDLKMEGLSRPARVALLNEIGTQEELLAELEQEYHLMQQGKADHAQVKEEYRAFLAWCRAFPETHEEATYQRKRDTLRYLGVTVRVFERGEREGRHEITLCPTALMRVLGNLPIGGQTLQCVSPNIPFFLRIIDGRILFYSPNIDTLTPAA